MYSDWVGKEKKLYDIHIVPLKMIGKFSNISIFGTLCLLGSHEKFTEYQFFLNVDSISIFDQCFLDINFSSMFSQKPK